MMHLIKPVQPGSTIVSAGMYDSLLWAHPFFLVYHLKVVNF
jgi:hypothetical protein